MTASPRPGKLRNRSAQFESLELRDCPAGELGAPPLLGDLDNNGLIDTADLLLVRGQIGRSGTNLAADVNGDGLVSLVDFSLVKQSLGTSTLTAFFQVGQKVYSPLDSITVTFNGVLKSFPLSAVQLDAAVDNRGNLVTSANTPVKKLRSNGTWDGFTWTIPNLRLPTLRVGNYTLSIRTDLLETESPMARGSDPVVRRTFIRTTQIADSDDFMRIIVNASEIYWDHARYENLDGHDGLSNIALGTFIRYDDNANFPYDASADPVRGISGVAGRESASSAYARLFDIYKTEHPQSVVAGYVGWLSVKTAESMLEEGIWPSNNEWIGGFDPSHLAPAIPTSDGADASVDLTNIDAHDELYRAHLQTALGLNGRPRNDMIQFDEVGYVYGIWEHTVPLMTRLREALSAHGVLVGINLGGWNWVRPSSLMPNILSELPRMTDSISIENLWSRSVAQFGSNRSVDATRAIINNVRTVLNQGTAIQLFPTARRETSNTFTITAVREVEVKPYIVNNNNPLNEDLTTALRITTSQPHRIFPLGGTPFERFSLKDLPPGMAGLPLEGWTAVPVPGQPNQVDIYNRFTRLETLKSQANIRTTINLRPPTTSTFSIVDQQASIRMLAGLAMMIRNPGDKINVAYTTGQIEPGNGVATNKENWFYWPRQFGDPVAEYVIDQVNPTTGLIIKMHRDFVGGTIEIYPEDGYVVTRPRTGIQASIDLGVSSAALNQQQFDTLFDEIDDSVAPSTPLVSATSQSPVTATTSPTSNPGSFLRRTLASSANAQTAPAITEQVIAEALANFDGEDDLDDSLEMTS